MAQTTTPTTQQPITIRVRDGTLECVVPPTSTQQTCQLKVVTQSSSGHVPFSILFIVTIVVTIALAVRLLSRKYYPIITGAVSQSGARRGERQGARHTEDELQRLRKALWSKLAISFGPMTLGLFLVLFKPSSLDIAVGTSVMAGGFIEGYRLLGEFFGAREEAFGILDRDSGRSERRSRPEQRSAAQRGARRPPGTR